MDNTTPETALDNPPVIIELCGKSYTFKEPVKRRAKVIRGMGISVIEGCDNLLQGDIPDTPEAVNAMVIDAVGPAAAAHLSAQMVDRMYDVIFEALQLSVADKNKVEAEAEDDEITTAYQKIMEVILRPFVGCTPGTDPATADPTHSVNTEAMTQ